MREYACVSDASAIGCVGTLTVATRGDRGAGEVLVTVRGAKEAFLAWSDRPRRRAPKSSWSTSGGQDGGRRALAGPRLI